MWGWLNGSFKKLRGQKQKWGNWLCSITVENYMQRFIPSAIGVNDENDSTIVKTLIWFGNIEHDIRELYIIHCHQSEFTTFGSSNFWIHCVWRCGVNKLGDPPWNELEKWHLIHSKIQNLSWNCNIFWNSIMQLGYEQNRLFVSGRFWWRRGRMAFIGRWHQGNCDQVSNSNGNMYLSCALDSSEFLEHVTSF